MKTYEAWAQEGRSVSRGQKAEHYLVSPDGTKSRALFREDQTEPAASTEGWTEIVPAAQRPEKVKREKPLIIVEQLDDSAVLVWCGANDKAIKMLKSGKYRYDAKSHKWRAPHTNLARVVAGFEARDFEVDDRTCPAL